MKTKRVCVKIFESSQNQKQKQKRNHSYNKETTSAPGVCLQKELHLIIS